MKQKEKLRSISDVISNVQISNKKNESTFTCIQIHQNWKRIIGSRWSEICKPVGYVHSCLIVQVPSSCHIHEVQFQKDFFIRKINEYVGCSFVEDIRCVI